MTDPDPLHVRIASAEDVGLMEQCRRLHSAGSVAIPTLQLLGPHEKLVHTEVAHAMRIAVTGAFGYSGRYIARRLLAAGHSVITLTNSPQRKNPFGEAVVAHPFHFDEPGKLTESLRGVDGLINTYWVRFDHRLFTHDQAVANTKVMFNAAKEAGVRRIVHVSITNPDIDSDLPYFRGKAELEQALMDLGLGYCILRPTVLFGKHPGAHVTGNGTWA